MAEHQVMSSVQSHNSHLYDLVSQPPQTRTCAMHASGSSVARVSAPLWRITVLHCRAKSDGVDDSGCGQDRGLQQLPALLPPNRILTTASAQPILPRLFRMTTPLLQQAEVPPDTIVQAMPPQLLA